MIHPHDLPELCRQRRPLGPTPCFWPDCDCTGAPRSPFADWLRGFVASVAGVTAASLALRWLRELCR